MLSPLDLLVASKRHANIVRFVQTEVFFSLRSVAWVKSVSGDSFWKGVSHER